MDNLIDNLVTACRYMLDSWYCRHPEAGIVKIEDALKHYEESPKNHAECMFCGTPVECPECGSKEINVSKKTQQQPDTGRKEGTYEKTNN
jgi:Zn ribbon nucleic-acid-binding protein